MSRFRTVHPNATLEDDTNYPIILNTNNAGFETRLTRRTKQVRQLQISGRYVILKSTKVVASRCKNLAISLSTAKECAGKPPDFKYIPSRQFSGPLALETSW